MPTSPLLVAAGVSLLFAATGCVYATGVTSPDGRAAFRVHCASQPQCAEKAGEICSGDYQVLSSATQVDGYAANGTGYANSPHEIVVACGGSPAPRSSPAAAPKGAPPRTAAAPEAAEPAKESGTCVAAHASVQETAAFWAGLHPEAKRLEEIPSRRDFVEVCRALPERVQRCLDARHRDEHPKPCLAVLKRLDAGEKNRIDSLFLE